MTSSQLSEHVTQLGRLIGLLHDDGTVNTNWFSDPVSELQDAPTRVSAMLDVLRTFFDAVDGTQYTLIGDEAWYSIFAGTSKVPTGLCLYAPAKPAKSGVLGLGVFAQEPIDDLTLSIYARVPLLYVQEGKQPQFILADGPAANQKIDVELDVYSAKPLQVPNDVAFNFASLKAAADFANEFTTSFDLTFYQNFDPKTKHKTELPPAAMPLTVARIAELVVQSNYWLNAYIGDAPVTIGDILSATGLVTQKTEASGATTYSFDDNTLKQLGTDSSAVFKKFIVNLVTKVIDELATNETLLVSIENGGIYAVKDASTHEYGLRLTIPDYTPLASTGNVQFSIELGSWFSHETDSNNWIREITKPKPESAVPAGINVFFLKIDGSTLSTTSRLQLASIGFNLAGAGGAPLIDVNGYSLGQAELRLYLDSSDWKYGFGISLDDVGFPLGPDFLTSQSGSKDSNTVVQNLLASGDSSGGGDAGKKTATNPVFSARAAYVKDLPALVEILDPQGNQTDVVWFPVQRRLGPVNCKKIGVGLHRNGDVRLDVAFDGGISLGPLNIDLDQLEVGVDLEHPADPAKYTFDLQGLDVTFSTASVEISGGLIKTTGANSLVAYDGEALIKTPKLAISALGSYCSLEGGGTSLFIFAVLNMPIGGPSFFFVTGLMAGFGYNRSLKIPAQDNVQEFPLLAGLIDSASIGGSHPSPATALQKLGDWVPPTRGEYWIAAGVQFTTFEVIKTNAVLIVEFGNDLLVAVLGVSTLKQPQTGTAYVYAELDIEVVFSPAAGELKASAVLAPSSYVLTPAAHLTGGFAFYSWFGSNTNAGDFVFTIGGYHPAFKPPPHYPVEPRLGINWQISDSLAMRGDAYFAITPVAMMGGAGLQITFADGPLRAWLKAQADVILFWKPFYLRADISVSVGVSMRVHLLFVDVTLSVEIGAQFHLWGPPVGGTVHVDWYIISFTIGFGADRIETPQLTWGEFKGLLPTKPAAQKKLSRAAGHLADEPVPAGTPVYLHITANRGLLRTQTVEGLTLWLVRAGQFQVTVGSAVPATTIDVNGVDGQGTPLVKEFGPKTEPATRPVALRNVNGGVKSDSYQSTQTIALLRLNAAEVADELAGIRACVISNGKTTKPDGCDANPEDIETWEIDLVTAELPSAMWGEPVPSGEKPDINPEKSTVTGATGVTLSPTAPDLSCTPEMKISEVFEDRIINAKYAYRLSIAETQEPTNTPPEVVDSFTDIAAINSDTVRKNRAALFDALQTLGTNPFTNNPLPNMAADPGLAFADEPLEGSPAGTAA